MIGGKGLCQCQRILEIIKTSNRIVRETRGSGVNDVRALGVLKACLRAFHCDCM